MSDVTRIKYYSTVNVSKGVIKKAIISIVVVCPSGQ